MFVDVMGFSRLTSDVCLAITENLTTSSLVPFASNRGTNDDCENWDSSGLSQPQVENAVQ